MAYKEARTPKNAQQPSMAYNR